MFLRMQQQLRHHGVLLIYTPLNQYRNASIEQQRQKEHSVYTANARTFNAGAPKNLFTLPKVDLHKYPKQIKTRAHTPISKDIAYTSRSICLIWEHKAPFTTRKNSTWETTDVNLRFLGFVLYWFGYGPMR